MDYPGSNYSLPPAGTSQYPVPASPYPGQGATQPSYASAFNDALHMLCSIMKLNAGAPYTGAPGGVDHHAFMRANIAASEGVNHLKAIVGAPATIPTESLKSPIRDDSGLERIIAMKNASKENFFDTTVQKPCAVCGVSSPLVCIVCLEEYYCSHDCQTEAWGEHELVCRKRGTASGGQRNGHAAIESNAEHGKVSAENESNKYNGEASVSTHTTESLRRPDANMYLRPSNRKPIIRNQKQHRQQTDTNSNASDASTDSKRTMNKDNYQKTFKRNSGFNNNSYLKPNADGDNNRKPYADSENHRKSYADSDNHRKPYADSDNHRKPYSENKTNGYLKPDSDSDTCKRSIKNDVTQTKPIPQPNSTAPRKTEAASSETEVKTRIEAGMVRNVALTSAESLTDYWVSLKDDESALMCLATELSKRITDRSPGLKKASVGDWCCKAFDGCWTRARVVNAANPLTVLYVDYGNSETATIDQLRELPADLGERSFPPFAIHVTHPAGISPADADQVFPLRFISHDPQGLWTVEKARPDELTVPTKPCGQDVSFDSQMGRNEESLPPMISSPSPSCVSTASSKSPYFEEGKIYKVHLQLPLSLTEFYVTKLELKKELEKLHSELNSVVSDSSQPIQNLEVKSKCAAKYLGEWYRASVLKLDPLTVLFIDYGNEETCQPSDIKELPPQFRTRMLTARVHLTKTPTKEQIMAMDSGEPILLEALRKDGSHWLVDYSTREELTEKTESCGQDVSFDSQMGRNEESLPPMISSPSPSCVSTASSKSPYFEEGKIYKVHLQLPLSLTEFYVTKLELKEELEKLHSELNSVVSDSSQPIQNLDVKSKCAAKYQGEWYRASVLKLDPLTVLFIDYGNEETCQPSDVKELPPKFRTRMFTARVRLTKTPTKEQIMAMDSGEPIQLEALRKDGSHWLVNYSTREQSNSITQITQQNQAMPSTDTPEQTESGAKPNRLGKFTKILDVFKEGDSAHCEAMRVLDDERIICILGSRASTREQYMKIYGLDLGDPLGEPYRPKMNEMVGVHWEENAPFWRRGLVLSELNDSYSVALVDSGFLVVSSNLRALPNDIKNIPLMSVKLCLTSSARVNVQQGDVLSVKLVKKLADSGEWEAEVYSTGDEAEHLGAGRFCEWNVEPDQVPELATLKLESGDEVIISSFHDISKIYVLPFSPQKAELYHSLSQEVAAEGIKAKRLGRDPAVGELVAAYWDQTCKHLRAQILEKVNAEGYYKVLFVDNGNIDEIHISKMKLLSHKLKTLRRCAVEVGLDGIEYKGLSPDAFNYLIQLAKLKELLKITFEDLKLVQLTKVSDNTDINKEIGKLFKPNKSQTHDTGTRQKQSDVFAMRTFPKRADLPEPDRDVILRIGETQKLMVPYVPPFKGVARDGRVEVVAFNANKKAITKYTLQLRKQMTDYVASQPTNRYVPRGGELCVCLQDEVPFRAECLKIFVNHARVRYVDYGNEVDVKFEKIFKMTNDLMQFPAYATYCYAEGIPANTTFEELKLVFEEIFEAKIKRFNDEHYTFYSPEIIARLTNKLK